VQQNIFNAENKRDKIFIDEVETLWREIPLRGSQTQDIHYTEDKASYKTPVLTYPLCSSHTFNSDTKPIVKGSSMESFTLGPTLRKTSHETKEHTLATTRELADLQFSLNTISKHYRILYWILTNYKLRRIYL
jgi:hypothetical protein